MDKVTRIAISLEPDLLERFDELILQKKYDSRSEAVRDLIRNFLTDQEWEKGIGKLAGSITLTYDISRPGLLDSIARIEHASNHLIHASSVIRLDEKTCMEIIAAQGSAFELQGLADSLQALKGVRNVVLARLSLK